MSAHVQVQWRVGGGGVELLSHHRLKVSFSEVLRKFDFIFSFLLRCGLVGM